MLAEYLTRTKRLLRNPKAGSTLYSDEDLTAYINEARSQLAGESLSIRNLATLPVTTQQSNFSSITLTAPTTGIRRVFNVRALWVQSGSGGVWLTPRPWPWFSLFVLGNPIVVPGQPERWAQFGQGVSGTIFLDPTPDGPYTLLVDAVCQPIDLVDDTTAEAIPYPWTDAVPYYATYLALTSAQRSQQAASFFQQYQIYTARARSISNPDQLQQNFLQAQDPTIGQKLGVRSGMSRGDLASLLGGGGGG